MRIRVRVRNRVFPPLASALAQYCSRQIRFNEDKSTSRSVSTTSPASPSLAHSHSSLPQTFVPSTEFRSEIHLPKFRRHHPPWQITRNSRSPRSRSCFKSVASPCLVTKQNSLRACRKTIVRRRPPAVSSLFSKARITVPQLAPPFLLDCYAFVAD